MTTSTNIKKPFVITKSKNVFSRHNNNQKEKKNVDIPFGDCFGLVLMPDGWKALK